MANPGWERYYRNEEKRNIAISCWQIITDLKLSRITVDEALDQLMEWKSMDCDRSQLDECCDLMGVNISD